jgi:hypothetical protein
MTDLKDNKVLIDSIAKEVDELLTIQKIDRKNALQVLSIVMKLVGFNYSHLSGQTKKEIVILVLQQISPNDMIDQAIPYLIDLLISVEKDQIKFNPTFVDWIKKCFSCKCCKKQKTS